MRKTVLTLCCVGCLVVGVTLFQNCGGANRRLTVTQSSHSFNYEDVVYGVLMLKSEGYSDVTVRPLDVSGLTMRVSTNPNAPHGVDFG